MDCISWHNEEEHWEDERLNEHESRFNWNKRNNTLKLTSATVSRCKYKNYFWGTAKMRGKNYASCWEDSMSCNSNCLWHFTLCIRIQTIIVTLLLFKVHSVKTRDKFPCTISPRHYWWLYGNLQPFWQNIYNYWLYICLSNMYVIIRTFMVIHGTAQGFCTLTHRQTPVTYSKICLIWHAIIWKTW